MVNMVSRVAREGEEGFEYKVGGFYGRGGLSADVAVAEAAKEPAAEAGKETAKDPAGKGPEAGKEPAKEAAKGPELVVDNTGKDKAVDKTVDASDVKWPDKGFPPDWADRLVDLQGLTGEDRTKELDRLKKQSSMGDVGKQNREAARKIQQLTEGVKGLVKLPGKDATKEEIAAYHKAVGVPEDVKEYIKSFPDRPKELGARSEEDMAAWNAALPVLQAKGYTPEQVSAAVALVEQAEVMTRQRMIETSKAWDKDSADTLRVEWNQKGQYDMEVEIANRAASAVFGDFMDKGERQEFFSLTLDNGRKLGSYPKLVKAFNNLGRNGLDAVDSDTPPETGESADGKDLDTRISEIRKLAHTGKAADEALYKKLQPELEKLMIRKTKRNAKAG